MSGDVLAQGVVYLAAAVACVPIARRLGLGSVLGYLIAGVLIGPHLLGLVGEGESVMHFAEFGVVMMLFLVGLELRPSLVWELRRPILGLGGLQVVVTALVVAGLAAALGLPFTVGVAVGLIVAMSSTAIVLSTLGEKHLLNTEGGRASFSVLLFQDIAVIPILAVFPLLAPGEGARAAAETTGRPAWHQGLMVLGAVALIVVLGRFVVRPAFRYLAETRVREVFTGFALLLVLAIAWLMDAVGLSAALGTFLAGVVLADSEYRHELESDIEPFKGLLLGLFFISVVAVSLKKLVVDRPLTIAALLVGIIAVKAGVLLGLTRLFRQGRSARWLTSVGLAQVGEFAFVLIGFGTERGVLAGELGSMLVAVVALSMVVTPALFIALERVVLPRVAERGTARPHDELADEHAHVVMAGFGRVGQVVGRMLRVSGFEVTVLDLDPAMVDLLRRLGQPVYYGDALRLDLLLAAGIQRAKLFVLAIDDVEKSVEVAELVRRHFPQLPIIARARNRAHYYRLRTLGVREVFRETMGTSLDMAQRSLRALGVRAHTAARIAHRWKERDDEALESMLGLVGTQAWEDEARKALRNFEQAMRSEFGQGTGDGAEQGWDNESLKEEAQVAAQERPAASADA